MDDLQPEDDLKPDASDRRTTRTRKSRSAPKLAISRQHLMIGIGVLVLLLLILGIASALKAPTAHEVAQQANGARDINLSAAAGESESGTSLPTSGDTSTSNTGQPQSISVPVISPTPTQSTPLTPPPGQQRIELPGNITDALSQQQEPIDELTQNGAVSSLPTAPATVTPPTKLTPPSAVKERVTSRPAQQTAQKPTTALPKAPSTTTPAKTATPPATKAAEKPAAAAQSASGPVLGAPASHYTLQLSSASRSDTLKAFAKQQKLENYAVYETKRDGQPWFVLVSGSYPSSADARKAISLLPADVQAKKPWVRPIRQVQQDLKK